MFQNNLIIPSFRANMYTPKGNTKQNGGRKMRTKFYLDGKKITKKALQERIGEERLKRMMQEAKETFLEDPLIQNVFYLGREGMLTIEFC